MPSPAPARQLLVINPNTSDSVTALLQHHVQDAVQASQQGDAAAVPAAQAVPAVPAVEVRCVTARLGAAYISSEASYAIACHAALDAWAAAMAPSASAAAPVPAPALEPPWRPDAVLIGCFGDPGLLALRELSPVPVSGLAEASFIQAARHGRFGVVTGGERWKPMLARLAQVLGCEALAGIDTVPLTGAQLAADPQRAHAVLAAACADMARRLDVQAIVLGGAALAGMAARIQAEVGVPLIDSVAAGAAHVLALPALPSLASSAMGAGGVSWRNLSPELQAALAGAC
ncbi:Asp/Glu racemase [Corticibacter populi]|uniref:Asp/Glu racemase n=1 Tax=Corticibacter populi TaxID=1550736 RepID=A0A3M6QHP7_9BURK|nr:aspartate/glutamate racemase family protein [Corticibacter populi]RMX02568.1 Asp/Glu racemase [Corticibacter populi]RZS33022.1 Asp/Glu/hydantoin racemase [Corticibacter populi]